MKLNILFSCLVNQTATNVSMRHTLIWSGIHQQYMLLKVIPSQKYAYVFADSFVLSFDIPDNLIIELRNLSTLWSFPVTLDLTDKWAILVSFIANMNITTDEERTKLIYMNLKKF
jgi:hypothetical protein